MDIFIFVLPTIFFLCLLFLFIKEEKKMEQTYLETKELKVQARIKELNEKSILFKDMVITLRDEFSLTTTEISEALLKSINHGKH